MKLPEGERFYSLEDSTRLREFYLKAYETFKDYTYINLPTVETYEPTVGGTPFIVGTCHDESVLNLRKDFTVSVARFLSSYRSLRLPLKVFYTGAVFSPREGETHQVGLEMVGLSGEEWDALVIRDIYRYLRACGIESVSISIGHARLVKKLLKNQDNHEKLFLAFIEKDFYTLRSYPHLLFLLKNQGGEEFLHECQELYPDVREEIQELMRLSRHLEGIPYVFDLSEVRTQEYYTGMVFEFFVRDYGYPVAGGGRYDELYRMFGLDVPSVGGAVYVDRLLEL